MTTEIESWGRYPKAQHRLRPHHWPGDRLNLDGIDTSVLPFGLGRSYGDVCLNDGQWLIPTRGLNRFISLDVDAGVLRCEAGVSLAEILEVIVPHGWFLPVTPGTKYVTVGGAIANDVHGKNHHRAGTFGRHVSQFELLRSEGDRLVCSEDSNPELYAATVGGMGLTGLITWAEIKLTKISSRMISQTATKFGSLGDFSSLSEEFEQSCDYTVAWIDCLAKGKSLGRGIFMAGNHASGGELSSSKKGAGPAGVPVDFPGFALNRLSIKAFNMLYYGKQFKKVVRNEIDYEPFFYPLDAVQNWNRIYGKRGFLQYQCVVPHENATAIADILGRIAASGLGSFLAVLKVMGDVPSPGMISFPRSGVTLALDFPIKGDRTFKLFKTLDEIVRAANGRLYSAKDACMSAEDFQAYYPNWNEFATHIDPKFSSSFWRRVTRK